MGRHAASHGLCFDDPRIPATRGALRLLACTGAYGPVNGYSDLAAKAPGTGLGAATGHFVDHLVKLTGRYGAHLFVCFDDPRIPATTNEEEGFFGAAKRLFRRTLGSGDTTHALVGNLGAEVLLAFADCRSPEALARILTSRTHGPKSHARNSLQSGNGPWCDISAGTLKTCGNGGFNLTNREPMPDHGNKQ